jgi:polyisoprenyl-phosphate glycosyltransferase
VLSVVVPAHNEEEVLDELHARLGAVLDDLDMPSEVILVDDGSRDLTAAKIVAIGARDPRFKLVRLSRNFGHQSAITAGIDLARGDAVVVMDADLQDPPDVIHAMVERWREGAQVVYGVREAREHDTAFKRASARGFYRLLDRLTDIDVPTDAGDFRLLDRVVVDALGQLREGDRYMRGIIAWLGFRQEEVRYERPPRFAGETKYPLRKMLRFATDGIVGFSNRPLEMATTIGFTIAAFAFLTGLFAAVSRIAGSGLVVPGWASILVALAFFSGIQLMVLGVLGTYIGRIYNEAKRRPLYVVESVHGFGEPPLRRSRAVLPEDHQVRTEA